MADDLEARLESHAQAFEGLLSLIPAKDYYGQDNSITDFPPHQDQWQRKKQTKEQKRAAKRAKLDPENRKSAKDIMDENERKRKRELGISSDDEDDMSDPADDVELERPADGLRKAKKVKVAAAANEAADGDKDDSAKKAAQAEKRREKRQLKKERTEKQKQKLEAKRAKKQEHSDVAEDATKNAAGVQDDDEDADEDDVDIDQSGEVEAMDISGLVDGDAQSDDSSAPTTPNLLSLDTSAIPSAASSSSSIVPPATSSKTSALPNGKPESAEPAAKSKKEKAFKLPEIDSEELQARLRARIEELRARRKADGPSGQPAKSRQELLDARRKKEEARKQHKKELRLKAKQEEERQNNERLRGSGSPLSTDIFSPRPIDENNFSFGRVAFEDGEADASLSSIAEHRKKKGPQDAKTALAAAEKKAARLAGYDESKRADIAEKDLWLNAKKRAHGERVRDDQSLLKKALKRKEQIKAKSSREWNDRIESVKHGKEMKQKKREDNLAKRKEDKGSKKGKGAKKGGAKKGRPGFEGKFKG
ncbi:hypothetical protein MBLNU459_g2998t2 [Dothideomycetes sp. NU459]